jgi:hypothetical protein
VFKKKIDIRLLDNRFSFVGVFLVFRDFRSLLQKTLKRNDPYFRIGIPRNAKFRYRKIEDFVLSDTSQEQAQV